MSTNDISGLVIILLVAPCGLVGLERVSRPSVLSRGEHEEWLRKSSGMAGSVMSAGMYALQKLMHPQAAEAVEVQKDMREGHYDVRQEASDDVDSNSGEA